MLAMIVLISRMDCICDISGVAVAVAVAGSGFGFGSGTVCVM